MIKIELAEITDLDRIMEITKACAIDLISKNIFQWNENYPSKEAFKKDIEKNTLYVFKNKLQITGCISICPDKDEEYEDVEWITKDFKNLYLHRLAVHPEYQKKGIGKFIIL